ncbi:MAG: ABC transporter permease, partial [Planctomycetota bacterium]
QADFASAWFMYGVLGVLVAFSVLNTQLMSVLERTKEFGIVMSLGVTPGRLGRLVLLETTLMGTIGMLLGMLGGGALIAWLSVQGFTYPGLEEMTSKFNLPDRIYPQLSVIGLLMGPAIVLFCSVVATVYPAIRLYRLEPVDAMRAA